MQPFLWSSWRFWIVLDSFENGNSGPAKWALKLLKCWVYRSISAFSKCHAHIPLSLNTFCFPVCTCCLYTWLSVTDCLCCQLLLPHTCFWFPSLGQIKKKKKAIEVSLDKCQHVSPCAHALFIPVSKVKETRLFGFGFEVSHLLGSDI